MILHRPVKTLETEGASASTEQAHGRANTPYLRVGSLIGRVFSVTAILAFTSGCVCYPGGSQTVNVGWRSAQAGSTTNIINGIEGGGSPSLTVPVSAIP